MATKFDELRVDKLFVAGREVVGEAELASPTVPSLPAQPFADSQAKTVKELVEDFNALIERLRWLGLLTDAD